MGTPKSTRMTHSGGRSNGCVEIHQRDGPADAATPGLPVCDVGPATPAIELEGDQLGELGRDVCHRIFCSTHAASRAEQRADIAESFVRRAVHNGDEQVPR